MDGGVAYQHLIMSYPKPVFELLNTVWLFYLKSKSSMMVLVQLESPYKNTGKPLTHNNDQTVSKD